jgi:hypothetical protein
VPENGSKQVPVWHDILNKKDTQMYLHLREVGTHGNMRVIRLKINNRFCRRRGFSKKQKKPRKALLRFRGVKVAVIAIKISRFVRAGKRSLAVLGRLL